MALKGIFIYLYWYTVYTFVYFSSPSQNSSENAEVILVLLAKYEALMWLITSNFHLRCLKNALLLIERIFPPVSQPMTCLEQLISAIIPQLHLLQHKGLLLFLSKGSVSLGMF